MDIKIEMAELVRLQKGDLLCFSVARPCKQESVAKMQKLIEKHLERIGFSKDDVCVMLLDDDVDVSVLRRDSE